VIFLSKINQGRIVRGRAEREQEQRPKWHQLIDESQTAEKTFEKATLRNVKKWEKNKDEFDIKGIDTKKPKDKRPDASPPGLGNNSVEEELKSIISSTKDKKKARKKSKEIEGIGDQEFDSAISSLKSKGDVYEPNQKEFDLI